MKRHALGWMAGFSSVFGTAAGLAQTTIDPALDVEVVVANGAGLSVPIALAFLGLDDFLVCEKNTGRVKRVTNGVINPTIALDLPVANNSERGLLGIALHPEFASNQFVYLYYSRSTTAGDGSSWADNRVERYTWDGTNLVSPALIVSFPSDGAQSNGPNHDGGVIRFGPDGKLYGVTGDLNRSGLEQNVTDTVIANVGGIFRLNDDGTVPVDNPFASDLRPAIQRQWCYGVRNSFGLTFDALTGNLWMTENGPSVMDEINLAFAGWNSGWTDLMGPDSLDPQGLGDLIMLPGATYSDPEFSYSSPIGITSIVFLNSKRFPCNLRDVCIVGDNNLGQLYRFDPNASRDGFVLTGGLADLVANTTAERNLVRWGTGWGVTGELLVGPDGYVYQVSLFTNEVRRIRPIQPVGDADGDGDVTSFDIAAFVLALTDPDAYALAFPGVSLLAGSDTNCDGTVDSFDIGSFVDALVGG